MVYFKVVSEVLAVTIIGNMDRSIGKVIICLERLRRSDLHRRGTDPWKGKGAVK